MRLSASEGTQQPRGVRLFICLFIYFYPHTAPRSPPVSCHKTCGTTSLNKAFNISREHKISTLGSLSDMFLLTQHFLKPHPFPPTLHLLSLTASWCYFFFIPPLSSFLAWYSRLFWHKHNRPSWLKKSIQINKKYIIKHTNTSKSFRYTFEQ